MTHGTMPAIIALAWRYLAPRLPPVDDRRLVGDVDTESVLGIASAITPVPGGVGPVTTEQLMRQTIQAALRASSMDETG